MADVLPPAVNGKDRTKSVVFPSLLHFPIVLITNRRLQCLLIPSYAEEHAVRYI